MAWLDKRGKSYRVVFEISGQTFKRSLQTTDQRVAMGRLAAVNRRIEMLERGEVDLPTDVDLPTFLMNDGTPKKTPLVLPPPSRTLGKVIPEFFQSIPAGSLETNTIGTLRIHLRHVARMLGEAFAIERLTFDDLQRYVERRGQETGRGERLINPVTIRKELASFSSLWTWLRRTGKVPREFPNRGLRFPKLNQKSKFQTWVEIERQIARGKLTAAEQAVLWKSLYLTTSEVEAVLDFVTEQQPVSWFTPMLVFAAHTGARRSELMRSEALDFDFEAGTVLIREKKRAKGKATTRTVPLTPRLRKVMQAWLPQTSGRHTFEHGGKPLTVGEATHYFYTVLAGSKWAKLKGWHVFRHSFISNCASRGIDQRMIDAWVGHTTEEMRKRYTHLLPNAQQAALASVFGGE